MWVSFGSEVAEKVWEEMMMCEDDNTLLNMMSQREFAQWVDQIVHKRASRAEKKFANISVT